MASKDEADGVSSTSKSTTDGAKVAAPAQPDPRPATLSKAALYVSLAAYNQTRIDNPADYMRQQSSTPKSIAEGSLIDFWERVSEAYHRGGSPSGGATGLASPRISKNTAGRPLTQQEIGDKLKQRALTLVGGRFNAQIGGGPRDSQSSSKKRRGGRSESSPKWKRGRMRRRQEDLYSSSSGITLSYSLDVMETQLRFLRELNDMWNEYAMGLFHVGDSGRGGGGGSDRTEEALLLDVADNNSTSIIMKRIASQKSPPIEWVGARAGVEECLQHRSWIGREGILVGETARTWRLYAVPPNGTASADDPAESITRAAASSRGKSEREESRQTTRTSTERGSSRSLKLFSVPKCGSALAILLPLKASTSSSTSKGDTGPNSSRCLRILLKDVSDRKE